MLWVILVLSIFTVADRIILTYRELRDAAARRSHEARRHAARPRALERVLLDLRARDLAYDLMVIAILAFVWLTPPDWLGDPDGARASGPIGWLLDDAMLTGVGIRDHAPQRLTIENSGSIRTIQALADSGLQHSRRARRARPGPASCR